MQEKFAHFPDRGCVYAPYAPCMVTPPSAYSAVKLFSKYSKFPTYVITVPKRYSLQTDGRTDGRTDRRTYDMQSHNRALRSIAR